MEPVRPPERIVPDETEPGIVAIHLKRYEFARPLCDGKVVLDAGCGVGYGTAHLSAVAQLVVGIDRSADAIEYARAHYARENVRFDVGDVLALPYDDGSFDVVCSFETIEHLREPAGLAREAARVLRADGTFVCSTPRAAETVVHPDNPFHELELSAADFEALLRKEFESVELFGQVRLRTKRHQLAQRLDILGLRKRLPALRRLSRPLLGTAAMAELDEDDLVIAHDLDHATELVAVCRR
jgi:SAM-dependent methyltransferase